MEPEAPRKRLMIREMVLENFKSYAGAQHVGPFHKCFSSVVGPNGSGKSNVIDAMLFVFGRRAKQLRFNKVAELIHNSTHHRNLERACVTPLPQPLLPPPAAGATPASPCQRSQSPPARLSPHAAPRRPAQEGDDFEVVPGSEFTVARTANRRAPRSARRRRRRPPPPRPARAAPRPLCAHAPRARRAPPAARRNNTSDYYVNGKRLGVKEVTGLLKAKGIDLDNNRFLILQGEVEQISLMKPKAEEKGETGLLEYLEDIIGTDGLIPQIEEEAKRLEEMNERRGGMVAKLKGVEKELGGLEGRKVEAEAYIDKQAERLRANMTGNAILKHNAEARRGRGRGRRGGRGAPPPGRFWPPERAQPTPPAARRARVPPPQAQLAENEEKAVAFGERLAHERTKLAGFDGALAALEADWAAADGALSATLKEAEAAAAAMKELEHRDTKIRMDLKHLKAKRAKAQTKHKAEGEQLEALEGDVSRWQQEIPADSAAAEALGAQLEGAEAALEEALEGIKGEVEGYHQQLTKVRAELAPWESQMAEVQSRIDVATSERDLLLRQQQDAKGRLAAAQEALAAAKQVAGEKEEEIQQIQEDVQQQRRVADAARRRLESAAGAEKELEGSLRRLRTTCASLKADSSSAASQGAVVAALLEAQRSGAIPGIYGRLGDLGAIDAKYDTAVSTACPALNYIVVESTSDAQRAVELLRRRGLGVATFLILDKQRGLAGQMAERVATPEGARRRCRRPHGAPPPPPPRHAAAAALAAPAALLSRRRRRRRAGVPRLFDLVRPSDPKLRLAFWYALRNTLVADSLEQASRIAYGSRDRRFARVVTLQGQLIAESGTMSGGGGKPRGGLMRLGSAAPRPAVDAKAAAKELADAEGQLAAAEAQLRQARADRDAAERELAAAERELARLEVAAPKAAQVAAAKKEEAADLQARLAELKAGTEVRKDDAARLSELSASLSAEAAQLAKLRASCAGLQKKVAALQDKIDNAGGEPLRRLREKVASLQAKRAEAAAGATKKAVQLKAASKQLDKLRKDIAKSAGEVEKLGRDISAAMEALDALTAEAGGVVARQEELAGAQAAQAAVLAEAAAKRDTKQKEVSIVRGVEVELEAALDKVKAANKDLAKSARDLARALAADAAELQKYIPGEEYAVPAEALTGDSAEAFFRVTVLEEELRVMAPDLSAIAAYREKEADFAARQAEYAAATKERDEVRSRYDALRKARLDGFMAGFNAISLKLKEMYQMITLGGDAELELVDTLDPFSEGIVFSVRPPKKSWKHIANLSGGEKTLSSLSLVFALHHYKPTPLYVMDEIDAALDFKNVSIVGHYIKERTKDAQFVIISLRNNMFELADRLVGIYKTDNATKTVTINPREFVVGPTAGQQRGGDAGAGAPDQRRGARAQQQPLAVPVA
ncbi:SMC4 [Scenedesmus sp. PABB004]|nr:SMC4 [Scenedesmus sp. PABB004]